MYECEYFWLFIKEIEISIRFKKNVFLKSVNQNIKYNFRKNELKKYNFRKFDRLKNIQWNLKEQRKYLFHIFSKIYLLMIFDK